jgi:4-hydroxy-tetrahydrodipicolinate reductase
MNVVISGYGAIGKLLVEKIIQSESYHLAGIVDFLGNKGVNNFKELTEIPDVIIDFSHPGVLPSLLEYALENNASLVIATTGYTAKDINAIKDASKTIPVLHTSNTSYGVNVLLDAIKALTKQLYTDYDIEVIEKHHNQKVDAPSGTAKMIVDEIEGVFNPSRTVYGRSGESKRENKEIGIHAVRGGTIAGEHTVLYAGEDEIIEIKHTALSKNVFVNGALKAARYIHNKPAGYYNMNDVLKGELE